MRHIAVAEDFIRDNLLKGKVMVAPAGEPGRDVKQIDEAVVANVPDRTHKAQAPEPVVPRNRFGSPELRQTFRGEPGDDRAVSKDHTGLRVHVMDCPVGKMDAYEFVLFIAGPLRAAYQAD
jgi:hypothetical protein